MANDDVLIVGKLDDKALRQSINDLVEYVDRNTSDMASSFVVSMDMMKGAMKDFAVSQKVSVTLMKEAWKDMSASFDAMFKAQSEASGGGKGSGKGAFDDGTVGQLKELINLEEKRRDKMYLGTAELRKQNELLDEQRAKLRSETTSDPKKLVQQYTSDIKLANLMMDKSLPDAERKLREMLRIKNELRATPVLDAEAMAALDKKILVLIGRIRDMRQNARGNTLKDVLGMDESSVDAVARKMRALKSIKVGNAGEIHQLGSEYQRLSRLQAELLGKSIQLTHSNNYLAQSFGYIRNRIVYAMTLGAVTNFVKQMYEVRGQYEMLERSLGILIDDMRRGSEIFNELNAMALKSPFTLMELATGAKQLLAYNFAEEEVVDTTRRLADISAALGVPMERLVYNLGQIRAQTVLTARDARDFANAGLAIVPMLAQMYTEEKRFGDEIVTTAQVFDMMSNKMVSYADVMKVINSVTDEGGKFFDFQAKQAETLRVKMANLTLAYNNMLNEVGEDNQSLIELPLKGLKLLFENWRMLGSVIKEVIVAYGSYRAAVLITNALNSRMFIGRILVNWRNYTTAIKSATGAMATFNAVTKMSPVGALAGGLAAIVGYMALFNDSMEDAGGYTEKFGAAGAKVINQTEALFDTLKGISKESSNYKKVMGELNSILEEYGIETVNETDSLEAINNKRRMAIALIKEEALERKHLNDVQKGRDDFQGTANEAKERFKESLKNALTGNDLLMTADDSLRKNSEAIANIIGDVIESNITLIAGKTGEEYQKGVEQIYAKIQEKMRVIGIDESTIDSQWVEKRWYGQVNIVDEYITKMKEAKEAQDDYTKAIDAAYESEKKATESGASFNDRVEQTQTQLMKAANDTESFYKKIDKLIKDYSGENIIDFLVKVKTEVPAWMSQKGLTELTKLSARFTALATNAKKAGKTSLNVNGTEFSIEQLFQRAAQYTQAAQDKAKDIESRKSSTITKEASEALKNYKAALDAATVAQNRFNRGKADQALVTEKTKAVQEAYNKALDAGVSKEELAKAKNKGKGGGSKKDPLGDALTKEIQLITDMQKLYKDYQKDGVDADKARIASSTEYQKSLKRQNDILKDFGIKGLTSEQLVGMDSRQLRDYYISLRDIASLKGNTKGVEALEKAISNLNVEITKTDYKKITDGLNSELGKIKDEYEFAIELDANPELGGMFADMFGIDTSGFTRSIDDYMFKVQSEFEKARRELGYGVTIDIFKANDDEWKKWGEWVGLSGDALDKFKANFVSAQDVAKKWAQDIVKQAQDLRYKLADNNGKIAIEEEKLANLRNKLAQETNDAQKELLRLQIQDQEQAIAKLKESLLQELSAYKNLFGGIAEHSAVMTRKLAKQYKTILDNAKKDAAGNFVITDGESQVTLSESTYYKEVKRVNDELRKSQSSIKAIKEAFTKGDDDVVDFWKGIELIADEMEKVASLANTIGDIAEYFGNPNEFNETAEAMRDISQSISGVATTAKGVGQIASGDYIGGAASVVSGLWQTISSWLDNSDKKIQEGIKNSERAVKRLELSYVDLQQAVDKAYGTAAIGAKQAALANKELQLAELQRQIQLEKSRESKNRDEDKILDLQKQYNELFYEIQNGYTEIVDDLMGTDVASFAENLVSSMIDAFKQGEDYMDVFNKKFDEMIDNMIMKSIVSRVVSQYLNQIWDSIDQRINDRSQEERNEYAKAQDYAKKVRGMSDEELKKEIAMQRTDNWGDFMRTLATLTDKDIEEYRKVVAAEEIAAKKRLDAASEFTGSDVDYIMGQITEVMPELGQKLKDILGEYYKFGESSEAQLSGLQQGIQGITEDTASALEAYMNGVSQQVYLQSDLLTQIRDAVVGFDLDVQVATMSQMLLQLQQSYQVQLAIQNILNGWSNPSGMAVRVEMV